MKLTIHQPEHLVYLGIVKKIADADTFVIFDSVQFKKNYFGNRNKIRTKDGWVWVTVPVVKQPLETTFKNTKISYSTPWQKKYLNAVKTSYGKAPYFHEYYPKLEKIILGAGESLCELNIDLLMFALESFGIKKNIVRSSELNIPSDIHGSDLCLEICRVMNADQYLAGTSGKDYLKLDTFKDMGIEVEFQDFRHPEYSQIGEDFISYMSFIDLLFMEGFRAKEILG